MVHIVYALAALACSSCNRPTGGSDDVRDTSGESVVVSDTVKVPQLWQAGEVVETLDTLTLTNFRAFEPQVITDSLFNVIDGRSFTNQTPVKRSDLRYIRLLHYDFEGSPRMGEIICNEKISHELSEIFRQLYEARYPIHSILLVENFDADDEASMIANNTSCFNTRGIGGGRQLSKHSYGLAVDINPRYNPLVKTRHGRRIVMPRNAEDYVDRSEDFPGKIDRDDAAYKLFTERGFRWGGAWKTVKDYQHFEKP